MELEDEDPQTRQEPDCERGVPAQLEHLNNPSDFTLHIYAKTMDLLMEKGPVKMSNFNFPINQEKRHEQKT